MESLATKGGCQNTECLCLKEKVPVSQTTTYTAHKYKWDDNSEEIPSNEDERKLINGICQTNSSFLTPELFPECRHCKGNNQDIYYEFVQKLAKLRKSHKKTLNFWQQLYEKNCVNETVAFNRMIEHGNVKKTKDIYPTHKIDLEFNVNEPYEDRCPVHEKDFCKDINKKQEILENVKKKNYFKRKAKRKKKKSIQYVKDNEFFPSRTLSYDESQWKKQVSEFPDYIDNVDDDNLELPLSEYCEPFTKMKPSVYHSCSFLDKDQNEKNNCHHKITVPKPFNMTLREANKEKKKSKTLIKFEKQCEENKRKEECECKKLFKASPVPAHVYMPLYDEIKKKDRQRSISQKNRKEYLESQQQPFTFVDRNKERDIRPSSCMSFLESEKRKHKKFKDKPIPKCVHSVDKKIAEMEQVKELNKMLRAQELSQSSSMPKGLERKCMEENVCNNLDEKKIPFTPCIHNYIPDYEILYKQFQKESLKKQKLKKNTVTQPFSFRTDDVALKRYIAKQEKHMFQESMDYDKLPARRKKSYSCPDTTHVIPSKTTTSCQLRKSANLMKIENQNVRECESDRCQHKHLKKEIQEKVRCYEKNPVTENKIPSYLKQQQDYLKELQDIYHRLKNRPLLFEQVETKNAKNKAEEKFYNTLKECGLDKNIIDVHLKEKPKYERLSLEKEDKGSCSEGDTANYAEYPPHVNSVTQYGDFVKHHCKNEEHLHGCEKKYFGERHHRNLFDEHLSDSSSEGTVTNKDNEGASTWSPKSPSNHTLPS